MPTAAAPSTSQNTKFTLVITGEASLDQSSLESMLEALVGQIRRFAQSEWKTVIDPNCVASIRGDLPHASQIISSEEQFYAGVLRPSSLTPMR